MAWLQSSRRLAQADCTRGWNGARIETACSVKSWLDNACVAAHGEGTKMGFDHELCISENDLPFIKQHGKRDEPIPCVQLLLAPDWNRRTS
jgi:hypothetical protein